MDKAEYRSKLEDINRLAEAGDFAGAAKVADEIDWRHVRSARTLSMIGEIYEAVKDYEKSREILKYAYKRSSSSKTVLYRLAELDIRCGYYDEARKYINEFEQISPNDTSRYILKYKLLKAEKAPYDDQIELLRNYRDAEYTERWAYELAKLYKKNGQNEKCIEECDDMILWFSEGKYVQKAMELKMSLTELTPSQKAMYEDGLRRAEEERLRAEAEKLREVPKEEPAGNDEVREADAIETVEKAVMDAESDGDDDEDEPARTSAADVISKMESAAAELTDEDDLGFRGDSVREEKPENVPLQKKIVGGIKSVFSGIRLPEKSAKKKAEAVEEDRTVIIDDGSDMPDAVEKMEAASAFVTEMDGDAADEAGVVNETLAAEMAEAEAAAEEAVSEAAKAEAPEASDAAEVSETGAADSARADNEDIMSGDAIDLDKLFKATGSELASEVASGNYEMTDSVTAELEDAARAAADKADKAAETVGRTLPDAPAAETDIPEEEVIKKAGDGMSDEDRLYARETDESLGLTREFHLKDALEKVFPGRGKKKAVSDDDTREFVRPEEAAKRTAEQAIGSGRKDPAESLEEAILEDEAVRAELYAGPEDVPEIPEEDSREALLELSSGYDLAEGEQDIPSAAFAEPDFFTVIPVEGRPFTADEKKAFSYFANIPGIDRQVTAAVADVRNNSGDKTSRSGNIIVMGRMGSGKTRLAEGLIKAICMSLGVKAAKEARIVAEDFNEKDPAVVVKKLAGGFLIIEAAGALSEDAVARLDQAMDFRTDDLVVILEDEKADLMALLAKYPDFAAKFTSKITVPVFTNDELVAFGKVYADEAGYKLDEMATLALYTMIGENQKDSEPVTVGIVAKMVEKAIDRNRRKLRFGRPELEDGKKVLMERDFHF